MCRNESGGHGDETNSPCFLQIFASNIFHLINETTYLHTHPTESPLFGSCQLLATQAPRLCSIPAEPLSVQAMNKKISYSRARNQRRRRYLCHLSIVVRNSVITPVINRAKTML